MPRLCAPTMNPVESSHIEAIGYDAPTRQLHVKFSGGKTYAYHGVHPQEHVALMAAESHGAFLQKHIRPGKQAQEVPAPKGSRKK